MQASAAGRLSLPSWVNARSVLGLVLFVTALVAGRAVMASNDVRFTVLVAERPLATGTRLSESDLTPISVHLPPEQVLRYVSRQREAVGLLLQRPLAAGELVSVDALGPTVEPQRVVTIPIEPEHAAAGRLAPGDVVDVWATFDRESEAVTKLIVGSVEVVGLLNRGGLVGEEALSGISVAIPPEAAPRVILALRVGQVDIVASDGSSSAGVRQTLNVDEL